MATAFRNRLSGGTWDELLAAGDKTKMPRMDDSALWSISPNIPGLDD